MTPHSSGARYIDSHAARLAASEIERTGGIAWVEPDIGSRGPLVKFFTPNDVASAYARGGVGSYKVDVPIPPHTTLEDLHTRVEGIRGWAYPEVDLDEMVIHVCVQVEPEEAEVVMLPRAMHAAVENLNDELVPYGWGRLSVEDLKRT